MIYVVLTVPILILLVYAAYHGRLAWISKRFKKVATGQLDLPLGPLAPRLGKISKRKLAKSEDEKLAEYHLLGTTMKMRAGMSEMQSVDPFDNQV